MYHETDSHNTSRPGQTLASICPGCGLPILFDPSELSERDDPALRDVMCAWCGTVTSKWMLASEAYDPEEQRQRQHAPGRTRFEPGLT
jgi:hypothetical protein